MFDLPEPLRPVMALKWGSKLTMKTMVSTVMAMGMVMVNVHDVSRVKCQ